MQFALIDDQPTIARKCGGTAFSLRAGETRRLTGPGIVVLIAQEGTS